MYKIWIQFWGKLLQFFDYVIISQERKQLLQQQLALNIWTTKPLAALEKASLFPAYWSFLAYQKKLRGTYRMHNKKQGMPAEPHPTLDLDPTTNYQLHLDVFYGTNWQIGWRKPHLTLGPQELRQIIPSLKTYLMKGSLVRILGIFWIWFWEPFSILVRKAASKSTI